jgi:hypothetical protein
MIDLKGTRSRAGPTRGRDRRGRWFRWGGTPPWGGPWRGGVETGECLRRRFGALDRKALQQLPVLRSTRPTPGASTQELITCGASDIRVGLPGAGESRRLLTGDAMLTWRAVERGLPVGKRWRRGPTRATPSPSTPPSRSPWPGGEASSLWSPGGSGRPGWGIRPGAGEGIVGPPPRRIIGPLDEASGTSSRVFYGAGWGRQGAGPPGEDPGPGSACPPAAGGGPENLRARP